MRLMVRGILWFGLYLFLVLLPLGTAVLSNPDRVAPSPLVALGVGVGFVGYALMALEFALISRIKSAAGLSESAHTRVPTDTSAVGVGASFRRKG